MTWTEFSSSATQLAVLIAATGLLYRLFRVFAPDVPEALMQAIAAILSTVASLAVSYTPTIPKYQWIILGVASGVLTSAQVIKLLDWSASAVTKTGAPELGLAEKAPAWFVAAMAQGMRVDAPAELVTPRSPATLEAQIKANEAAVARVTPPPEPPAPKPRED
jgi:hypothetical protein